MSTIDIVCGHCATAFREHHSRVRAGTAISCQACGGLIVFDNESRDPNIRKALSAARRIRMNLTEPAKVKVATIKL